MSKMIPREMAARIGGGLLSFPVTPFKPDYSFDEATYCANMDWLCGQPGRLARRVLRRRPGGHRAGAGVPADDQGAAAGALRPGARRPAPGWAARTGGKTFSLFGDTDAADGYYRAVNELADTCLMLQPDAGALIIEVRRLGRRPRLARKLAAKKSSAPGCFIVQSARNLLSPYTASVKEHLAGLSLLKHLDGVISFTEEQYHLAMLEIELMNRANKALFRKAGRKLAFLPHCLRDLEAACRAAPAGIDDACKGCSAQCHVNAVSTLLRQQGIEPYLWMTANLKRGNSFLGCEIVVSVLEFQELN